MIPVNLNHSDCQRIWYFADLFALCGSVFNKPEKSSTLAQHIVHNAPTNVNAIPLN